MEALQGVELTDTNRPCGLTTKYSTEYSVGYSAECAFARSSAMIIATADVLGIAPIARVVQKPRLNTLRSVVEKFPVVIAEGKHPFPSRTRQLSPPAPMVLRP